MIRRLTSWAGTCVPRNSRRWIAFAALAMLPQSRLASAPFDDHVHFQRFTPREGLPAAVVYCGIQDSRGFLWFGTADGVARFDGHTFRVFRPDPTDPAALSNGAVLEMREDEIGDLWMATEGGLDVWRRAAERFEHFRHDPANPASLADDATQCLLRDPGGTFWVGTRRAGLSRFDPRSGSFRVFGAQPGTPGGVGDTWVRCLLRDHAGTLWAGTGSGGLSRIESETGAIRTYLNRSGDASSLIDNRVTSLAEDRAGGLWIGTEAGLCRLDAAGERFEQHSLATDGENADGAPSISTLIVEADGTLWVGTSGQGFFRYDPATHRSVQHRRSRFAANTLWTDSIRSALRDQNGDLWIGHFPAGISHFDRSAAAFQVFATVPGEANTMSDDQVLCFMEDPSGDLWVGTDNGGISRWRAAAGRWENYPPSPRVPGRLGGKSVLSILRDGRGLVWIATWDGGLNRLDEGSGTFTHFLPTSGRPDSLSNLHTWALVEDRERRLWIATIGGGLERYLPETDSFEHHRHDASNPHSLNDDIVSSLLVGRDGTLWAGTPKGLGRLNRTTGDWDRFLDVPGRRGALTGYWIFDLLEDRDGYIWASSEGGGLSRLDPKTGTAESFRTADGLPSDVLHGLIEDDAGGLWIGSNRGLIRLEPRTRDVRVFDESNGLPGSQFNPHARLKLATGELLFGSTEGFVRFDPRAFTVAARPPPVVLTEFSVFSRPVRPGQRGSPLQRSITETRRLEIPARDTVIGFEFAALSYRSASRSRYQVKMEGFDREWRDLAGQRRATFTNLAPGTYRLRVRAANGDGIWNDTGASLDVIIVPPWWRTWWFLSGAACSVLGLAATAGWAVSARRLRESQRQRELQAERERAAERSRAADALQVLNDELERRVADRTSQLSAAVRELEAFSYSVSHDLRAPLRSMHGFGRVLLEEYAPKLDDEGRDCLNRICAASQRMGLLIDDLLNLSKVTRDEMRRVDVDLSALASEIMTELRENHPGRKIEFSAAPGLIGNGDAHLLRIVLENLLGNACKFTARREVARIEFGLGSRNGQPAYYVRDNGAGFDMTYAQKMFGAFQRFHTATEFPGTGIGLATVQRIIHRHGGEVSAEGRPDAGATFYFTLPRPNQSLS